VKTIKRTLIASFIMTLAIIMFIPLAFSASISVNVNGRPVDFDGQGPIIIEGRTFVPVRGVFEALGFDINWDGVIQTVTLSGRGHLIRIGVGRDTFIVDGTIMPLDVPAVIIEGRILLPIRNVLESVDIIVEWNADDAMVIVRDPFLSEPMQPIRAEQIRGTSTTISTGHFGTMWSQHGINASYAIKQDGSLWVWGGRFGGVLVDDEIVDTHWDEPAKIMENVHSVAGCVSGAMVIKNDNSLWRVHNDGAIWWYEDSEPVPSIYTNKIMGNVAYVSAGNGYVMIIDTGETLWGMGYNSSGQLGDGTTMYWDRPVRVMENVASVSASKTGLGLTLAIRTDGSLWAWGANATGGLGIGIAYSTSNPNPVQVMENVAAVSTSNETVMAITTDGVLWGWGWNIYGQLGDGRAGIAHFNNPTPVEIMDGVIAVSSGGLHTVAIRFDGSLWAWGSNARGQLGDGTTINRHSPVKVLDNVVEVSAGSEHTIAIRADGSLWAWGSNTEGQLGNGSMVSSNEPIRIIDGIRLP